MTNPLSISNPTRTELTSQVLIGCSKIVSELEDIFASIPYKNLLDAILAPRIRAFSPLGRFGYPLEAMFRAVVASYYLHLKSIAHLVRRLPDDPILAVTCGFDPRDIPHRSTFSRFHKKLIEHQDWLDWCFNEATSELRYLLPEFGKIVAVDSTPVHTHSNPKKEPVSDPEAGWIVKGSGNKKEWHFGYKLHMTVDANFELPISKMFTLARFSDTEAMLPLLRQTKDQLSWFSPDAVIADKGYDSTSNYHGIVDEFGASPVIPLSPRSKNPIPKISGSPSCPICPGGLRLAFRSRDKTKGKVQFQCPARNGKTHCPLPVPCGLRMIWIREGTDYRRFGHKIQRWTREWEETWRKRVSVERVFSRLKQTRRLEDHCFRGFDRINLHTSLSALVMLAVALAKLKAGQIHRVRDCVRTVG